MRFSEKRAFIELLLAAGYTKVGTGYKRISHDAKYDLDTHNWVTLFEPATEGRMDLQIYAYIGGDEDGDDYCYNTQIISVTVIELETLINIFKRNHG